MSILLEFHHNKSEVLNETALHFFMEICCRLVLKTD